MPKADAVRLRHMFDAASEAIGFVKDRSREELDQDRLLVLGLVKSLEIIGEAAAKVQSETRAMDESIPWVDIIGMRNRLIHGYFDVDLDLVWDTVRHDLPPLASQLQKLLEIIPP